MPTHKPKTSASHALECLKGVKLKVTKPRLAILSVLIEQHGPFTMEEIHHAVKKSGVDRVTVYRCLDTFHHNGIVRRCDFGDGPVRFEYQGVGAEHHHHVICRSCKTITDLNQCWVEKIEASLRKLGFSDITHSLEFFALCSKCGAKKR